MQYGINYFLKNMGFFSRIFSRKDVLVMEDVHDVPQNDTDDAENTVCNKEHAHQKTCTEKSPFLDDAESDRPF